MDRKRKIQTANSVWDLLVPASRMSILDEFQGEMNVPLMIAMGASTVPNSVKGVADLIGVDENRASDLIFRWSVDNGVITNEMFKSFID